MSESYLADNLRSLREAKKVFPEIYPVNSFILHGRPTLFMKAATVSRISALSVAGRYLTFLEQLPFDGSVGHSILSPTEPSATTAVPNKYDSLKRRMENLRQNGTMGIGRDILLN